VIGWWGEHFGVPSSIWCAGLVCFVAGLAALVWQLRASGDRIVVERRGLRVRVAVAAGQIPPALSVGELAGRVGRTGIPSAEVPS
jgi:hypothetical protein